jgi:hypothetical protein
MLIQTMTAEPALHKFSVQEYLQMHECGIFNEADHTELLEGEIYHRSPVGPLHVLVVNRLTKILVQQAGDQALVTTQTPVILNDRLFA